MSTIDGMKLLESPQILLKEGTEATLEQLKAKWVEFNISRCYEVGVLQSKQHRGVHTFISKCYNAPRKGWSSNTICMAHMKCIGNSKDKMKITSRLKCWCLLNTKL